MRWTRAPIGVSVVLLGLALGFFLTYPGVDTWDSYLHFLQGRWLVSRYLGFATPVPDPVVQWYGPAWELFLGAAAEALDSLHDPTWVRHSLNFALLPVTLWAVFRFLVRRGESTATAALAVSGLLGFVRWGGHALLNTKDFPLACFYLLSALWLGRWIERQEAPRIRDLVLGTWMAMLPYAVRPPMLLPFLAFWAAAVGISWKTAKAPARVQCIALAALLPPLVLLSTLYTIWPTLWPFEFRDWTRSFSVFANFPNDSVTRIFGQTFSGRALPAWYVPAWALVSLTPFTLLLILGGLARTGWEITSRGVRLARWQWALVFFAISPMVGFLMHRPVMYDEDRHFLFVFPPWIVLGALGLRHFRESFRWILAGALVLTAAHAYVRWGRYAYIYKSAWLPKRAAREFMGDYWGVCLNEAVQQLPRFLSSSEEPFAYLGPPNLFQVQAWRLRYARFSPRPDFPVLYPQYFKAPTRGDLAVVYNRDRGLDGYHIDVASGRAQIVWSTPLPTGEAACEILRYR